mgnify:CR=1 FL=1
MRDVEHRDAFVGAGLGGEPIFGGSDPGVAVVGGQGVGIAPRDAGRVGGGVPGEDEAGEFIGKRAEHVGRNGQAKRVFEGAGSDAQINAAAEQVNRKREGESAVWAVAVKDGGCGADEGISRDDAGFTAMALGEGGEGGVFRMVGTHGDETVGGFDAAGQGGAAGARISDKVIGAMRMDDADSRQGGHVQGESDSAGAGAAEIFGELDVRPAHAVADHHDDIARRGRLCHGEQR